MSEPGNNIPIDPRFTTGLLSDVCEVLKKHGYQPASDKVYADMLVDLFRLVRRFEGLTGLE